MKHHLQSHYFFLWMCVVNVTVAMAFGYLSPLTGYVQGDHSPAYTLFTTHFTHQNTQHLLTNMLALWMLLYLFPNKIKTILTSYFLCILMTAAYVYATEIHAFVGFSALLYCLPGSYLFHSLVTKKYHISLLVLMILYVYLYMIVPMNSQENSLWQPMTPAHLIGFVSGFLTALINHGPIEQTSILD